MCILSDLFIPALTQLTVLSHLVDKSGLEQKLDERYLWKEPLRRIAIRSSRGECTAAFILAPLDTAHGFDDDAPELDLDFVRSPAVNASHADWTNNLCISRSCYNSRSM